MEKEFSRFIVRMHEEIWGNLRWRTGVALESVPFLARAVVKADEDKKIIRIQVTGEQQMDYFAEIRHTLEKIHGTFQKLEVTEQIPLPDENKITVEYRELLGYELEGVEEYLVGKLRRRYSVKELLGSIETREETHRRLQQEQSTQKKNPDH